MYYVKKQTPLFEQHQGQTFKNTKIVGKSLVYFSKKTATAAVLPLVKH